MKPYRIAVLNSHPIQYFAPLYREIAKTADIEITAYYCSRQGLEQGYVDPGFGHEVVWDVPLLEGYRHVFLANPLGDRGVGGFFSLFNPGIVSELFHHRYDAVWLHGHNHLTNVLALCAAKIVGTKVFMRGETHLLLRRAPIKRLLRKALMRWFYGICDACLYIGSRNRDFYRSLGVPERRLFFVPYSVDNAAFFSATERSRALRDATRAELGVADGIPLILFASKLTSRKRPADLLLAYESLRASGVAAALVYIGDGSERGDLEREVREKAIPDVHFVGFKNQTELPRYLAASNVFVLPSTDEPWGLIINEAMCAGLPVITTTEVGAAADLVQDGHTGFAYSAGCVDELAAALRKVLENEDLRRQLGSAARDCIGRWGYAQCIEGLRAALEQCVGEVPRQGEVSGRS